MSQFENKKPNTNYVFTGEALQRRQEQPRIHPEAGVCDRQATAELPREAAQLAEVAEDQLLHRARSDSSRAFRLAVPVHCFQSSVSSSGNIF